MNVAIVSCFAVTHRIEYIVQAMRELGNDVTVLTSDFNHRTKQKIEEKNNEYLYIKTKEYKKNISIKRIYSHYDFSKNVIKQLEQINPDLIYAMIPPNFLAKYIIKFKKKKRNIKIIFDIIDLWPETLPTKKYKKILALPLKYWSNLRDKNIKKADYIFTECDLYQKKLKDKLPSNTETLHLAEKYIGYENNIDDQMVNIAYLGSINNIVDLELIIKILKEIKKFKKMKMHLIGDGERREELIHKMQEEDIEYQYYGKIYDDKSKAEIFNKCLFGINIMKESTCVGLTLKSIDYFKFGLPILNNIKEDTKKIVEKYNVGFNINANNIEKVSKEIAQMKNKEFIQLKENVCKMYKKEFEINILKEKIKNIMEKI